MRKTASLFPWHLTLKCFLSCLPERILVGDDLLPVVTVIIGICIFFFSNSIVNKDAGYDRETD